MDFDSYVKRQFSTNINCLQSNGEGEFLSHQIKQYLTKNGNSHQVSYPHTPQQNGKAKLKHCIILNIGLSQLFHSQLSNQYGLKAFKL